MEKKTVKRVKSGTNDEFLDSVAFLKKYLAGEKPGAEFDPAEKKRRAEAVRRLNKIEKIWGAVVKLMPGHMCGKYPIF